MEKKYLKKLFLLIFFFLTCAPFSSFAATLSVSPASGTHEVGERFTVRVIAASADPFNAVSLSLLFPPSLFSLDSVSGTGSLISFWVKEPTISSVAGTVTLEGVTPGGIKQSSGTVVSVTLHGKSVGTDTVSFQSGQILANDGQGTDITGQMTGAKFTIISATPKVSPTTKVPTTSKIPTTPKVVSTPTITPTLTVTPEIKPEIETRQPEPTLNAPEITLGEKYGAQAITGTSEYSKKQVLITFLSSEGAKIFITGNTDEDGSFTLVMPRSLKHGNYAVTARLLGEAGISGGDSNIIAVSVGNIFSDVGWEIEFIFFLLFILVLYLISRMILHVRDDRKKRLIIKEEAEDAEKILHETLDVLKQDMVIRQQTGVTELEKITGMNNDIDRAEQKIEKEIAGIDKIE